MWCIGDQGLLSSLLTPLTPAQKKAQNASRIASLQQKIAQLQGTLASYKQDLARTIAWDKQCGNRRPSSTESNIRGNITSVQRSIADAKAEIARLRSMK